jgi:hypothetical protein
MQPFAHDVYFSLVENSENMKQQLVAACKELLANHQGCLFFAVGVLAAECNRPVNDREFDVALHLVFSNKEAHDVYQTSERHLQFIAKSKANWQKVRVFDSYVSS